MHEFFVAVCSTLEGSSIFDKEPEETGFHVAITFTDDLDLRAYYEWICFVFSECLYNCPNS